MAEHPQPDQHGCPDPADRPALTKQEALDLLLAHARAPHESETVPIEEGLGRILARPLVSDIELPGWDNSAMDGYALRCCDLATDRAGGSAAAPTRLRVSQRIPAGAPGSPLEPGTTARIFTGAPIPPGRPGSGSTGGCGWRCSPAGMSW